MNKRPPTVTIPAILFLIFEILALLGVITNGLTMMLASKPDGVLMANPAVAAMNASPEFLLYSKIMVPITLVLAALGIAVGIGLFKGKELARTTGIKLAVLKIVTVLVGTWMTLTYLNPQIAKTMAAMGGQSQAMMQSTMQAAMLAGAIGGALFGIAVGVAFIILLTRASAVAFCRGEAVNSSPPPMP